MVISILRKIKDYLKELIKLFYIFPGYGRLLNEYRGCSGKKIILIGTPAHGNLGDHAIAVTELEFIRDYCKEAEIFEIPTPLYKTHGKFLKNNVGKDDVIVISGGGWMGNLWIHNELMIRSIVEDFSSNKVIIFPQTLYYTEDTVGLKTAEETRKCFQKHKNIYLSVRESNSMRAASELLGLSEDDGRLLFCPDMVLYGSLSTADKVKKDNKSVLLCLRGDIEKSADISSVKNLIDSFGYNTENISTVDTALIKKKEREYRLKALLNSFAEAEFVVTDRLHAMIFSLLAGVPCYVFNNVTGKVFGVATYLQKSGFPVKMLGGIEEINKDTFNLSGSAYELKGELKAYFSSLGQLLDS